MLGWFSLVTILAGGKGWLAHLTNGSVKLLDRVRVWDDSSQNVHYELTSNEDGSIIAHGCIPPNEWKQLRDNVIRSFPANVSISMLANFLTVANELID